jgi:hypothetical protein
MNRRPSTATVLLVASLVIVLTAIAAALAGGRADATPTVGVAFSKNACRVSPKTVPAGPTRFRLVNTTARRASFSAAGRSVGIASKRTRIVTWRLLVGTVRYACRLGSKGLGRGSLTVTAPPRQPEPVPPPAKEATIAVTGQPEVVFDWSTQKCAEVDIPDSPARAFRDAQGRIQLIASNDVPRRMIGTSLDSLSRQCQPVMTSHRDPRPEAFDDSEWLFAPYTTDGQTVHALVHNEYHGEEHGSAACPSGNNGWCWYASVTLAVSRDAGLTYGHATAPAHLVAAPPARYVPDQAGLGYSGATNIVRNPADGYYYTLIHRAPRGPNGHGPCVMRTRALDEPGSWRFWDGQSFNGAFASPYPSPTSSQFCSVVVQGLAESLSWNTELGRWLLIGSKAFSLTDGAFFFSTSTDLVNWTAPRAFHPVELAFTHTCSEPDPKAYASFLDPSSPDRNFGVTGRTGWVYYTQLNYQDCHMTYDRDLMRIPVEITTTP